MTPANALRLAALFTAVGTLATTLATSWQLDKTKQALAEANVHIADLERERNKAWDLYQTDEAKLKDFQDACEGMNCKDVFSNEAAGVIASTYWSKKLSVQELEDFCRYSSLVNLGANFPGAKLRSFVQIEKNHGLGQEFLTTCSWSIPSKLWCRKDDVTP